MQISDKAKLLIEKLESITGKKVLVEFIGDTAVAPSAPSASPKLSNRQLGAQRALKTKGFDDWTEDQYALCYWIVVYHKRTLPHPYNTMPLEQIAEDAGVKKSTLLMNAENLKYIISGQSSLMSSSPKSQEFVNKFADMPKEELVKLVMNAFDAEPKAATQNPENSNSIANKYKNADFAKTKPKVEKAKQMTTPELETINKNRAAKGLPRLIMRGNNVVVESFKKNKSFLVERVNITPDNTGKQIIDKIIVKASGDRSKEIALANNVANKITDPNTLLNNYNAANSLGKTELANVFYNKVDNIMKESFVNKAMNKLTEIVGKKIVLEGENKKISKLELNEWFAANGYDKLLSLLDKGIKVADALRGYSIFYPEDWKGNETAELEKKIKSVYHNMINGLKGVKAPAAQKNIDGGTPSFVDKAINKAKKFAGIDATENPNQKPAYPKAHKFAMESVKPEDKQALNEWFAMTNYKRLLSILDKCAKQAEQIGNFKGKNLQIDPKVILSKLKQIWKLFHASKASGENKSFAADSINKLSAKGIKVPEAPKPIPAISAPPKDKVGVVDKTKDKVKDLGNKTIDKAKNLGNKVVDKAKEFANRDATENKDQKPAYPKTNKFAMEAKELKGQELEEAVNTENHFDVKLSNGQIIKNVKFLNTNSFVTAEGKTMMDQDIVATREC